MIIITWVVTLLRVTTSAEFLGWAAAALAVVAINFLIFASITWFASDRRGWQEFLLWWREWS